jgi:hypothetical protein
MLKYINDYVSEFEKELNIPLMNKEGDRPLVEYIEDAWRSLEIVKNIKIMKFEYNDNESEIDINKFIFKREKKKKKKDRVNYKFVNNDRYGCLTVWIQITAEEKDQRTLETSVHQKVIKKQMLIPLQDEDGYYYIKGKRYYIIYQLVDKSTYTSASSVTLKSLMPIAVKRGSIRTEDLVKSELSKKDVCGTEFLLPIYNVFVFKKEIPIILFFAANGLDYALSFLGVDNILKFIENIDNMDNDNYLYFQISSKLFIEVNKQIFLKYPYIQGMVGMFLHVCTNRFTLQDLNNKDIWLKKLSNNNTVEKGNDILVFFNRLLDETTKKILMLDDYNKDDIYSLLRWIMQNFNELRMKDNLSLDNKRLRCNEYVASLLTQEFSKRLNRIITLGAKATLADFSDMFRFSGVILIQKMHSSGILRFDDTINDMDFFSRFKYTTKGPHSLGGKNSNNISIRYRGIHPSFLGNIDLLVCGNSDPGTSGVLTPFGKIDGLYFNNSREPDNFAYDFKNDVADIMKKDGVEYIEIKAENKDDYYKILSELAKFNKECITVSGTSRDNYTVILENDENSEDSDNDTSEETADMKGNENEKES